MVVAALATTALGRSGAAREVAAAVLVAARPPHVAIDVRIDVGVRVGIDVRIRVHIRVRIEMRIRVDVRVCVDMRIGVDIRVRRSRPGAPCGVWNWPCAPCGVWNWPCEPCTEPWNGPRSLWNCWRSAAFWNPTLP